VDVPHLTDAQGDLVAVGDVEHGEVVTGAAYEMEHLGDVYGVARPCVGEQLGRDPLVSDHRRI
jgi:hypothetical protein